MRSKAHRIVVVLGTALAGAVLLAGPAQAAERPDDRSGMLGVGAAQAAVVATPDAFERAALRAIEAAPPDAFERAVLRGPVQVAVRPDDRAEMRGPGAVAPTVSVEAASADSGFAWGNALLGAGGVLGVLLLGAAATLTIRHRNRVVLR